MSVPLHDLERLRRSLPDLLDPTRICCLLDMIGEPCEGHAPLADLRHDSDFGVLDDVLSEAIERAAR